MCERDGQKRERSRETANRSTTASVAPKKRRIQWNRTGLPRKGSFVRAIYDNICPKRLVEFLSDADPGSANAYCEPKVPVLPTSSDALTVWASAEKVYCTDDLSPEEIETIERFLSRTFETKDYPEITSMSYWPSCGGAALSASFGGGATSAALG